jgi:hypothetical protein
MNRIFVVFAFLALRLPAAAQPAPDPFQALKFLEKTWEAKTQGGGEVKTSGIYTFRRELGGHVLARHSTSDPGCKAPAAFDCEHGDLLYVYADAPGQPLKAIYFDNEGHVIHYDVSTPKPNTVVFLSDTSVPGPQFRLIYELKEGSMTGKFQMHMPGQAEWKSYLEWSGSKK